MMVVVDDMTLGDIVTDNAVRFPDVVADRHGRRTVTHAALRDRALRLVSAMAAAGVRRQDRIAVLSRNSVEFGELMADVLRRVTPLMVFYSKEFEATVADLAPRLPVPPLLVSMGGPEMTDFEEFL